VQDPTRRDILRRNDLQPYEVIYIGHCGGLGEVFATLSELYYLPTSYFAPQLEEFNGHPQAQQGDRYLIATNADSRIGRLDNNQVEKLKDKISAYWSRRLPPSAVPVDSASILGHTRQYLSTAVASARRRLRRS
jgi:hypothetical protein